MALNPRVLAEGLEQPLRDLERALTWLHESESESKHTQSPKDAILELAEAFAGEVARFYEALYDVAGHERLARRLRNSTHVRPDGDDGPGPGPVPAAIGDPGIDDVTEAIAA